jgi:alkaline phosphatase
VGTLVVAAGDITCPPDMEVGGECRQADTARLAERLDPAAVLALGDLVYPGGDPEGFAKAYAPTWGRLRDRTYPAVGNHEYLSAGAEPYFRYWGARAGPGWYSVDVAGWHLVALNANCAKVGCGADSPQGKWLEADLARSHARCTLAFWHEPRWSSGLHGPDVGTDPLWRAVHAAGVDVVLSGHDHHYERFAPLSADGKPVAPGVGTRQFVVGTGGRSLYPIVRDLAGSEQRVATAYGLLALRLQPNAYSWQFVATDGRILDAGGPTPCR